MTRLDIGSRGRISYNQKDAQIESKLWELSLSPGSVVSLQKKEAQKLVIRHDEELIEIPTSLAELIHIDKIGVN